MSTDPVTVETKSSLWDHRGVWTTITIVITIIVALLSGVAGSYMATAAIEVEVSTMTERVNNLEARVLHLDDSKASSSDLLNVSNTHAAAINKVTDKADRLSDCTSELKSKMETMQDDHKTLAEIRERIAKLEAASK